MSSKIYLPETFTASTGKKLKNDAILPPGAGALKLWDVGHSAGGLGAVGVPGDGLLFPNIAEADAKLLIPAGDASTLSGRFSLSNSGAGTGRERTAKGGLHVAVRQDTLVNNSGASLRFASNGANSIAAYLVANPTHRYYVSLWDRVTRPGTLIGNPPAPALAIHTTSASATGNYVALFNQAGIDGITANSNPAYATEGRLVGAGGNSLGNLFRNIATLTSRGTLPPGPIENMIIRWGALGAWSGFISGNPGQALSSIFYRMYLEDLTVSGRTYAEVDAIDYSLWQAAFAVGGRFYNDTWTDPATLAAA